MPDTAAETAFHAGQYAQVIVLLRGHARGARELALLGIAHARNGQLEQAELPLHRAAILGDEEGTVEYGNLLRLTGRFDDACAHFAEIHASLRDYELKLRALRWWGVAEFQAGRTQSGLKKVERAWHGYVAHGNDELTGRVTQSLAQMHAVLGHFARAKLLLSERGGLGVGAPKARRGASGLDVQLRTQLTRAKAEGNFKRVVLFANQLLKVGPLDVEVLRERVTAARVVATSHDLARYVAELHRAYN